MRTLDPHRDHLYELFCELHDHLHILINCFAHLVLEKIYPAHVVYIN